jgi:hypothetical protein
MIRVSPLPDTESRLTTSSRAVSTGSVGIATSSTGVTISVGGVTTTSSSAHVDIGTILVEIKESRRSSESKTR